MRSQNTKLCLQCKTNVVRGRKPSEWIISDFCSKECSKRYKMVEYTCLGCLKSFLSSDKNRKFCSNSCSVRHSQLGQKYSEDRKLNISSSLKNIDKVKCELCDKYIHPCGITNHIKITHENREIFFRIRRGSRKIKEQNFLNWVERKTIQWEFGIRVLRRFLMEFCDNKCQECGWSQIHSVTNNVPLQLEHIDGNYTNNTFLNIKILCPNCHSLTPTYGRLNYGNGRKLRNKSILP